VRFSPAGASVKTSKSTLRIAVIADTHGRLPANLHALVAGADEIWHIGDFCDLATFEACKSLGPPLVAVLGNNDFTLDLPKTLDIKRHGHSFHLVHIPPARLPAAGFLLHGHTHVPRDERVGPTRVWNPGSLGKADKGAPRSYAWLTLDPDGTVDWKVMRL